MPGIANRRHFYFQIFKKLFFRYSHPNKIQQIIIAPRK